MLRRTPLNTMYGKRRAIAGNLLRLARRKQRAALGESVNTAFRVATAPWAVPYEAGSKFQQLAGTQRDYPDDHEAEIASLSGVAKGAGKVAKRLRKPRIGSRPGLKKLPPPPDTAILDGKTLDSRLKPAAARRASPVSKGFGRRLGTGLLAGGALTAGIARQQITRGYRDRMDQYRAMEADRMAGEAELVNKPSNEKTAAQKKLQAPATKAPKRVKSKAPQVKPDKAVKTSAQGNQTPGTTSTEQRQTSPEDHYNQRVSDFQKRLASITLSGGPAAKPSPTLTPSGKPARESARAFFGNLVEAKRLQSEMAMKKALKSKADVTIRRGTPLSHTFYSNDRKHIYSGRPLSMRQKIVAEHRRKKFALPQNFENYDPISIGNHFDQLSDRGMLEPGRKSLDDSRLRNTWRKTKRVTGRAYRKVKGLFKGILSARKPSPKAKESDSSENGFCNFSVGNVMYPSECNCSSCVALLETSASSFGQSLRAGTQAAAPVGAAVGNIHELTDNLKDKGKEEIIGALLRRRKRKKQKRVAESAHADLNYKNTLRRELEYHNRSPEPPSIQRRPNTYFSVFGGMRRLDKLAHTMALAAVTMQGLGPIVARRLGRQHVADARRAANTTRKVFQGVPINESDPFPKFTRREQAFARGYPKTAAFLKAPFGTTKRAVQAGLYRGVRKAGVRGRYAYPVAVVGSTALAGAGAYAGKKLVYDPFSKKVHRAEEILKKRKDEKLKQLRGRGNVTEKVR